MSRTKLELAIDLLQCLTERKMSYTLSLLLFLL